MILLKIRRVTSSGSKITFERCFEGHNEDRILGWDFATTKVLASKHIHFFLELIELINQEQRS